MNYNLNLRLFIVVIGYYSDDSNVKRWKVGKSINWKHPASWCLFFHWFYPVTGQCYRSAPPHHEDQGPNLKSKGLCERFSLSKLAAAGPRHIARYKFDITSCTYLLTYLCHTCKNRKLKMWGSGLLAKKRGVPCIDSIIGIGNRSRIWPPFHVQWLVKIIFFFNVVLCYMKLISLS